MTTNVEQHVVERIGNALVMDRPFPHFFVEDIFPEDFYARLLENMPGNDCYVPLGETPYVNKGAYMERLVLELTDAEIDRLPGETGTFWRDANTWLAGAPLLYAICGKFADIVAARFGDNLDTVAFAPQTIVVRDRTKYAIGPHTDSPQRFLSALFYCPQDNSMEHLGTSIYEPLDRSFRCRGGPHYGFDKFANVGTMPFRRNSLFCFVKTDNSFHGVEPIADEAIERDLILYNLRVVDLVKAAAA